MLKSLYSGVSGIQTQQVRMDVIGNNIANVNTVGYKKGSVAFQELLSQTISGASSPDGNRGGTNAMQVGLGVKVGSITNQFTQGNLQYTGSNTDLALEGNGFFVVGEGNSLRYTRAGNFTLDQNGSLVQSSNGMIAQGWVADSAGVVNTNDPLGNVEVPITKTISARATSSVTYGQNIDSRICGNAVYQPSPMVVTDGTSGETAQVSIALTATGNFNEWTYEMKAVGTDGATIAGLAGGTGTIKMDKDGKVTATGSDATLTFGSGESLKLAPPALGSAVGGRFTVSSSGDSAAEDMRGSFSPATPYVTTAQVYDSLGGTHEIQITLSKTSDNEWAWQAGSDESGVSVTGGGKLNYDSSSGKLLTQTGGAVTVDLGSGRGSLEVTPDFSATTQFASDNAMLASGQDGYASGSLESFSIDSSGSINGVFSNGVTMKMAQLALANFANPSGLVKEEGSFYSVSRNSGEAYIGTAGSGGLGSLSSGNLETSNVDLSQEFTELITTQRGYEASAKMITTSDELLQDLLNLKR